MIDYTKAAISKTVDDIKRFSYFFNISLNTLYIIYLVYAMICGIGNIYVNIILCAVTCAYFVFYLVTYGRFEKKKLKKLFTRTYRWIKILLKAFTLAVTVYGIYIATEHVTVLSVVMASLTAVGWILQVIVTVTVSFAESRLEFIVAAMEADIEEMRRPIDKIQGFIRKVKGEPEAPKQEPGKMRIKLECAVEKYRAERDRRKAEKKAEKKNMRESETETAAK